MSKSEHLIIITGISCSLKNVTRKVRKEIITQKKPKL
jgi:hypothetical protein